MFVSGRKANWLSKEKIFSNQAYLAFVFHIGVSFFPWEESTKRSLCVGRWHGRRVKLVLQTFCMVHKRLFYDIFEYYAPYWECHRDEENQNNLNKVQVLQGNNRLAQIGKQKAKSRKQEALDGLSPWVRELVPVSR